MQQNGSLLQQIQEAQHIQLQMQEHCGREAQKAVDSVVSQACAREAELIANIQSGAVGPVFEQ